MSRDRSSCNRRLFMVQTQTACQENGGPSRRHTQVVFNNPLILAAAVSGSGALKSVDVQHVWALHFFVQGQVVPALATENR